ncbi:cytochrome P450 [Brevibacillus humidisoli]|uniref:cytochrome P450 n=1 Tax=Brevibacillus humidisoli TaxID=2895522 RepID=UPI001E385DFD|nr:cytochrome P450 [Brevibacillus humidisoli]UFJ42380.1 cytochrome P450 [Brevibacillus humidisoli]
MGTVQIGPRGLPITGNLYWFRKDPLSFLQRMADEYGEMVHFRFGPRHFYLLNNPEHIKEVLVTKQAHFKKAKGLQTAKAVIGEGILTSEGETHMRQRRLMQPSFQPRQIRTYADTMVAKAKKLIQDWQDGDVRPISDDMMSLTLAIIVETMFSLDMEQDVKAGVHKIGHAIDIGMKHVTRKASSFLDLPDKLPTKGNKELQQARSVLDEVIYTIINERRERADAGERNDLLGLLLAARDEQDGTGMTDQQVRDEVMTIFLAGHETTANTLSWTWYLLSQHPEAERAMQEELDTVLSGRDPSFEDLQQLPYLHNVIWESMRLYPAVWAINREVVSEVEIGGHTFTPGDTLMMSQYVMHRNPRYYANPDQFRPERFSGDLLKRNPPYAFFPFGGGPRICIGNHFALMEAALILATIGQTYQLRLVDNHPPVQPEPLITLRPNPGLRMVVSKRTQTS